MQKDNKIFDDFARLGTNAFGSILEVKREIEGMVQAQLDKILKRENLVSREEFEVVKAMAAKAREENEEFKKRLDRLEK